MFFIIPRAFGHLVRRNCDFALPSGECARVYLLERGTYFKFFGMSMSAYAYTLVRLVIILLCYMLKQFTHFGSELVAYWVVKKFQFILYTRIITICSSSTSFK